MPLARGTRLGPYEITGPLGKGGMGEVYRAKDTTLDREVAIKVLPDAFASDRERLARFDREAKVLAALNHPNIAQILGLEEQDGVRAIVMELVEGKTLADIIKGGPIPLETAIGYAKQVADALEFAHDNAKPVIHRDLKPANVQVTHEGVVKILDFGLAKALTDEPVTAAGDPEDAPTLTMGPTVGGMILGTAAYMSPEQARGNTLDRRSDIWSFGVMLCEMVTGKRPFPGADVAEVLAAVINQEPKLDAVPARLRPVIERCLRKDPRKRWYSMEDVRFALDEAPADSVNDASRLAKLSLIPWAAAVLLVGIVALGFVHFSETPPGHPRITVQIAPPEGAMSNFQLSPDGRFLAFVTGEAFTRKIWIRSLDGLETRLLTDTPGPGAVFWSRDGEYIGFSSADKLYKIARGGGPPVLLAEGPAGYSGGVWFDDGVILLTTGSGLFRIPSSGGAPTKIDDHEGNWPTWLADRRFLYRRRDGVFVGSLDGGKPTQILPDAAVSSYVPAAKPGLPGHLLFVREGTLLAQSFNPDKLELTGDAIPVAARTSDLDSIGNGQFTASSNGVLAFRRGTTATVALTWLDRAGKRLQDAGQPYRSSSNPTIRLSPNDSQAIVPVAGASQVDLWIADFSRNTFTRFTFEGSSGGLWSPEGRKILWTDKDGKHYLRAADGSGENEFLYKNNCRCLIYDWSQDGKLSSFASDNGTKVNNWMAAIVGDRKPFSYRQSGFNEFYAMFSPDSRWMAYTSDESGQNQIFIESIPAGKGRWQISIESGEWPIWRRDGKELFYRQGTKVMAVPIRLSDTSVTTGKPEALFEVPPNMRFQVSRDGQRFLMAMPVAGSTAVTVDTDWRAGLAK
ncbi:MAG: protein kinase [Acidobacteriota bacterium]